MGMETERVSDIVPFVAHNLVECQNEDDDFTKMMNPEGWIEDYGNDAQIATYDKTGTCDIGLVRGWKLVEVMEHFGQGGLLAGNRFEKDGKSILVVNESKWQHVGECKMTVCANDKESIELLLQDFAPDLARNIKISVNSHVSQWW